MGGEELGEAYPLGNASWKSRGRAAACGLSHALPNHRRKKKWFFITAVKTAAGLVLRLESPKRSPRYQLNLIILVIYRTTLMMSHTSFLPR